MIRIDLLVALERLRCPNQRPVLEILEEQAFTPPEKLNEIRHQTGRVNLVVGGNSGPVRMWWNRDEQ